MPSPSRWELFCTVVDNFGDAGVCWRLARQIAAELGVPVRLWIDRPEVLAALWPALDPAAERQSAAGVEICRWHAGADFAGVEAAAVVIEAFACELPESVIARMAAAPMPPRWINLEYLSGEEWVDGCHGLSSIHPATGLAKTFWIPGYSEASGGLIRERNLERARQAFLAHERGEFLHKLGVTAAADTVVLSLFAYPQAPIEALLGQLAEAAEPSVCLLTPGAASAAAARLFGVPALAAGERLRRGALTAVALPFFDQDGYDRLLWSCDLNLVRGEDSFLRAQWAGRPMVWNIYHQEEGAHAPKLEAFLGHYAQGLDVEIAALWGDFNRAWNDGALPAGAWTGLRRALPALSAHAEWWRASQFERADLLSRLVQNSGISL